MFPSLTSRSSFFGTVWDSPLFLCPVGYQKAFHPQGEVAVAQAAQKTRSLQILSTMTSSSVEEVAKARGTPPWFQLYIPSTWAGTEKLVHRVEAAGCPVLVWTVDLLGGRNGETGERFRRTDTRDCTLCHTSARGGVRNRPMLDGIEGAVNPPNATWEFVDRLKKLTRMKLVLKGIETREDARLCREHGVDAIVVSNHGGRATEDLRPTIDSLPEVVDGVSGQIPVLVDGGFRRGTDIYKALASGARAVGIGRPYIYGLAAFGQQGVERVVEILRAELTMVMKQCGTPSIDRITSASISEKAVVGSIRGGGETAGTTRRATPGHIGSAASIPALTPWPHAAGNTDPAGTRATAAPGRLFPSARSRPPAPMS